VKIGWRCCLFILAQPEADAIFWALWPGGRRGPALVRKIFFNPFGDLGIVRESFKPYLNHLNRGKGPELEVTARLEVAARFVGPWEISRIGCRVPRVAGSNGASLGSGAIIVGTAKNLFKCLERFGFNGATLFSGVSIVGKGSEFFPVL